MSKNTVAIVSENVFFYLSGGGPSQTVYAGSGSAWTSESTSPFELSNNDVTGANWTATSAPAMVVFRGTRPYSRRRNNVTETIGLQLKATTKDNAVLLAQTLFRALDTGDMGQPPQLGNTVGTSACYAEVYNADLAILGNYINEPPGTTNATPHMFRALLTITRSAYFGVRDGNVELAITSQTIANTGTGTPDNVVPYATMSGDFVNSGQPLNVALTTPSSTAGPPYYLASVYQRVYTNTAQSVVTSSTTGVTATAVATHDMTQYFRRKGITPRVLARITSPNALLEMQLTVTDFGNSTAVYTSPWIGFSTNAVLVDFGSFSPEPWRIMAADSFSVAASFNFSYRSTSGGATTGTIDYVEVLDAYTFATITGPTVSTTGWLRAITFPDSRNQLVCLPYESTFATSVTTYGDLGNLGVVRGELPKYVAGASLYAAWHDSSGAHTTTRTADVFASHAPLWQGARGND